jgi:cephalosporin hydroxylase
MPKNYMTEYLKFADKIEEIARDDSAHLDQQMLMYWLIRGMKPGAVVEIGTHRGVTSLYLAHALYDNGKGHLITCDPYDYGQQDNFDKIPELAEYITYDNIMGVDLGINNVDFVFVDGFHGYSEVLDEIEYFKPRLSKEGLMVFHDCGGDNDSVGVNAAIQDCGIEATWVPMSGKLRIYSSFKDYPIKWPL